ncbi:MAG TPA: replicative DNA helicase [Candidatus Dormibacteraeota bacterium]
MATAPPLTTGRSEGRVPPHDLEAEGSVLGSVLLDPTAITRVLDLLTPEDFYRENNAQIYRAASELFRQGEPIDNITLADELTRMGVLERVGGRAHLAMLQEGVPTAANIEYYARIVKAKAQKRRLISAGATVSSLGFDDAVEADDALNEAQRAVYDIADQRVGTHLEVLYPLLKEAMERVDAQMARGTGVLGVPSGFHDLDRVTSGFKNSDLVVVAARPAMGKALALDTPIPTPDGWKTMGTLRIGDQVFDENGRPCTITFATEVQLGRDCYEIEFSDGEVIVADAEHLWAVNARTARGPLTLTTRQMVSSVLLANGRPNYSIPTAGPLRYTAVPGDRGRPEPPSSGRVAVGARLDVALRAPVAERAALLRELVDAGGDYVTDHREAASEVAELMIGLGLVARVSDADGLVRVSVEPQGERFVMDIRGIASVPVRCIQVDSPSHLYLAGRACIATHNTSLALNIALHAAVHAKVPTAVFSLEMSKEQLVERLLCQQAKIDSQRMHRGMLSDREYEQLVMAIGPLENAPIYIDESPVLDELTVLLKARQAKLQFNIGLVVIDYLQLMKGRGGKDDNRVQEVSSISRSLKGLARELKIPVIALSQLSRGPEARPNKRPMLSDLRDSGSIEQDSDVVIFLYRDDYYNEKSEEPGICEVIISKHRNGPTGTVKLRFRKEQTLFYNLETRRAGSDEE